MILSASSCKQVVVKTVIKEVPVPFFEPIDPKLLVQCKEMQFWDGMTIKDLAKEFSLGMVELKVCNERIKEIAKNNHDRDNTKNNF